MANLFVAMSDSQKNQMLNKFNADRKTRKIHGSTAEALSWFWSTDFNYENKKAPLDF